MSKLQNSDNFESRKSKDFLGEKNSNDSERMMLEMNLLQNELAQLEQQMQFIEKYFQDIQNLEKSLEELKGAKKDQELFSPLGQEVFIKTKIVNPNEILVNVGEKVLVKKTIDETKEIIEEKTKRAIEIKNQIAGQMEILLNELNKMEHVLNDDCDCSDPNHHH
ncbi:prefoldin subunit alpha [Candidatus Pacearchaeota archaeon]|nr:prefoldin subunit alpha [Candidatus Pacearchaeota archaeon]